MNIVDYNFSYFVYLLKFLAKIHRILNCGLKLQTDGFGLDTEIGILSYLAFVQDVQLKNVIHDMVKVKYSFPLFKSVKRSSSNPKIQLNNFFYRIRFMEHRKIINWLIRFHIFSHWPVNQKSFYSKWCPSFWIFVSFLFEWTFYA